MGNAAVAAAKVQSMLLALNSAGNGLTLQDLSRYLQLPPERVVLALQDLNAAAVEVLGYPLIAVLPQLTEGQATADAAQNLRNLSTVLRLAGGSRLDFLDAPRLRQLVDGRGRVSVLPVSDSTNSVLARCLKNCVSGDAVLSELQTAARGRRGNRWQQGIATQLSLSLVWKFQAMQETWGLPLLAALATVEALAPLQLPIKIKWPNDLYLHGHKLCGILVELQAAPALHAGGVWAVIGIGLNVYADADMAARLSERQIVALGRYGELSLDRTELAARIISTLRRELSSFAAHGFKPYLAAWRQHDYLQGKAVVLELDNGQHIAAIAAGADERGRLLLNTAEGLQAFASGHIVSVDSAQP